MLIDVLTAFTQSSDNLLYSGICPSSAAIMNKNHLLQVFSHVQCVPNLIILIVVHFIYALLHTFRMVTITESAYLDSSLGFP